MPWGITHRFKGPIPARAGQPENAKENRLDQRAYPRSRGATHRGWEVATGDCGLSPLARGNRHHGLIKVVVPGPIPARAGQPARRAMTATACRAYPRSRGATHLGSPLDNPIGGLSPLARGNRQRGKGQRQHGGPIPARAGQPSSRTTGRTLKRAYPRSRGATCCWAHWQCSIRGLSPLARGNPAWISMDDAVAGPIPARAGQPPSLRARISATRAYPRSRGATKARTDVRLPGHGLSPLARGNLAASELADEFGGPIPARAGQPSRRSVTSTMTWAYPRSRGAT